MDALIKGLVQITGDSGMLTGKAEIEAFVADCRSRYKGDAAYLVRPRSTAEVAAAVALCVERTLPESFIATAGALRRARLMLASLSVDTDRMQRNLELTSGMSL